MTDQFVISDNADLRIVVDATSYEQAATIALGRLFPRRPGAIWAHRTTGIHGKSGWFQAYVPAQGDAAETTLGKSFHVGQPG